MNTNFKTPNKMFPKMFKTFTLYIIATLAVFFCYVYFFGSPKVIDLMPEFGSDADDVGLFTELAQNLLKTENLDCDLSLSFSDEKNCLDVLLQGNVTFDKQTGIDVDLSVAYNNQLFDLHAVYLAENSDLYVFDGEEIYKFNLGRQTTNAQSTNEQTQLSQTQSKTKSETKSQTQSEMKSETQTDMLAQKQQNASDGQKNGSALKSLGFKEVVDVASQVLGINTNFFEEIEQMLGLDFENFDVTSLMQSLKIEENAYDDGSVDFNIGLGDAVKAFISCDEHFNLKEITLPQKIEIGSCKLNFSAKVNRMNDFNIQGKTQDLVEVKFDNLPTLDVSGATDYAKFLSNVCAQNNVLGIDFQLQQSASEAQEEIFANLLIDKAQGLKMQLCTNIDGADVQISVLENKIYLEVGSTKICFAWQDITAFAGRVDNILSQNFGQGIASFVGQALRKYFPEFAEKLRLKNILDFCLNELVGNQLVQFLPKNVLESKNLYEITFKNNALLQFEKQDDAFSLSFKQDFENQKSVSANVAVYGAQSSVQVEEDYFDLRHLFPLADVVDEIFAQKGAQGTIEVSCNNFVAEGNYALALENDNLKFEAKLSALGENFALFVDKNQLYFTAGNVVWQCQVDEFDEYLEKLLQVFESGLPICEAQDPNGSNLAQSLQAENLKNMFSALLQIFKQLSISHTADADVYVQNLSNVFSVSFENSVAKLCYKNQDLTAKISLFAGKKALTPPQANDTFQALLTKIENLADYICNQKVSFNLNMDVLGNKVTGILQANLKENLIELTNLKLGNFTLNLQSSNNTIYVQLLIKKQAKTDTLKFKIEKDKTDKLVEILNTILNEQTTERTAFDAFSPFLEQIFGQDISNLNIWQILQKTSLSLKGFQDGYNFALDFDAENKHTSANLNLQFLENQLFAISLKFEDLLDINLSRRTFAQNKIYENQYFDLMSPSKGTITLQYSYAEPSVGKQTLDVVANVEFDFQNTCYLHIWTQIMGVDFNLLVTEQGAQLRVADFVFGTKFENSQQVFDYVLQLFSTSQNAPQQNTLIDQFKNLLQAVAAFDATQANFSVIMNSSTLKVTGTLSPNINLLIDIKDEQVLSSKAELEKNTTDETLLFEKIKNITTYLQNGVFEFDFTITYNGNDVTNSYGSLNTSGTLKIYAPNLFQKSTSAEIEISNLKIFGENMNIRVHQGVMYLSYGGVKIKTALQSSSKNVSQTLQEVFAKISNGAFKVDFGIYQSLFEALQNFTLKDFFQNIKLYITGNIQNQELQSLDVAVGKGAGIVSQEIALFNFLFENNNISEISVGLFNHLISNGDATLKESVAQIRLKTLNSQKSTIKPFQAQDFADFGENVAQSALAAYQVQQNVYAFSSDIFVRYNQSVLKALLTVMLLDDQTQSENLSPVISLSTNVCGVNLNVYLLGQQLYVDFGGLQLQADLSTNTLGEFVETIKQIVWQQQTESEAQNNFDTFQTAVSALEVLLPSLDRVYASWTSENGKTQNGLQIETDKSLKIGDSVFLSDIIMQIFVENTAQFSQTSSSAQSAQNTQSAHKTIVPSKVLLGANVKAANGSTKQTSYAPLKDNQANVLETSATTNKNFAAYATSFKFGKQVTDLSKIFVANSGESFFNFSRVAAANGGTAKLSDFSDFSTFSIVASSLLNSLMLQEVDYEISGQIASGQYVTTISSSVVQLEVQDLPLGQTSSNAIFGNKAIVAQGQISLLLGNMQTRALEFLYQSANKNVEQNGQIYFTYKKSDTNKFSAKISSDSAMQIVTSIVQLFGKTELQASGAISNLENLLSQLSELGKLIKHIKFTPNLQQNKGACVEIGLSLNPGNVGTIVLNFSGNKQDLKLEQIVLNNICFGQTKINLAILLKKAQHKFNYASKNPLSGHFNLSGMEEIAKAVANMKQFSSYHITGNIDLIGSILGLKLNWDIPVDVKIKMDSNGKPTVLATVEIPILLGVNNDGPYQFGDTEAGHSRIVKIYYKDGFVYIYRTEVVDQYFGITDRIYQKHIKTTLQDLINNPMLYLKYCTGFSDEIMAKFNEPFASQKQHNANLSKIVKRYSVDSHKMNFDIVLNLQELTGTSQMGDFAFGLSIGCNRQTNFKNYLQAASFKFEMSFVNIVEVVVQSNNFEVNIADEVDISEADEYVKNHLKDGLNVNYETLDA